MNLDIDSFHNLSSPIHKWDPRVKILSLVILMFTFAVTKNIISAVLALGISAFFVYVSNIPFNFVFKKIKGVLLFLGPFMLIMPFTAGGPFLNLGLFNISLHGIYFAALVIIRGVAIVSLIFPIVSTSKFDVTLKSLERLKVPSKITQMFLFTYRYIFVFASELSRMNTAMRARCFRPGTNLFTMQTYGNFVGVLLVRSFERTEEVYNAMISRGYKGELKTKYTYEITSLDIVKMLGTISVAVLLLFLDRGVF